MGGKRNADRFREESVNTFCDKSVGPSCSIDMGFIKKKYMNPTKVVLAMIVPCKFTRNKYTKLPCKYMYENRGCKMIKKLARPLAIPERNLKVLLHGSKLEIINKE